MKRMTAPIIMGTAWVLWGFVLLMGWVGCGTTLAQKVNLTNEATRDLRVVVGPQINAACKAAAVECVAVGTEKAKCTALTKCRTVRDAFYKAVEGVHGVIALYKVKKAAGKPTGDLAGILEAAQKALAEAYDLAVKAGYITLAQPTGAGHWEGPNPKK